MLTTIDSLGFEPLRRRLARRLALGLLVPATLCAACGDSDNEPSDDPDEVEPSPEPMPDSGDTPQPEPAPGGDPPAAPAECLDDCTGDLACENQTAEDFPDLDATEAEWSPQCGDRIAYVIRGECDDGKTLLRMSIDILGEIRFFDSDGAFVGVITTSDDGGGTCDGKTFWPEYIACDNPVVTDVVCGNSPLQEGDTAFRDPWADQ